MSRLLPLDQIQNWQLSTAYFPNTELLTGNLGFNHGRPLVELIPPKTKIINEAQKTPTITHNYSTKHRICMAKSNSTTLYYNNQYKQHLCFFFFFEEITSF